MKECDRPGIAPGPAMGAWASPIPAPDLPGPFAIPEDAAVLEWWAALVSNLQGAVLVYREGVPDEKPRDMAVQAQEEALKSVRALYGHRHARNIQNAAIEAARAAWDALPDDAHRANAAEGGWVSHAVYCGRVLWHTYAVHQAKTTRCVERSYRATERLFRCAFPDELTGPVLAHFESALSTTEKAS